MPCKECGGHGGHHKPSCAFSPAVLQITNKDCTIFHRVEIPAAMGDETTVPPANGKYRNVLLTYEAGGNAYLYSSDGIPTKLTFAATDYAALEDKPAINGVTLEGDLSSEDLHIEGGGGEDPTLYLYTNQDIADVMTDWSSQGPAMLYGTWSPDAPESSVSPFQLEDGTPVTIKDLVDALLGNQRVVFVHGPHGAIYDSTTGEVDMSYGFTVENIATTGEVDSGGTSFSVAFAVVSPHLPDFVQGASENPGWENTVWSVIEYRKDAETSEIGNASMFFLFNYFRKN